MPIWTILGWFIGQTLAAAILYSSYKKQNLGASLQETKRLTATFASIAYFLMWTGFFAGIGTAVEMTLN